jgi:hypothetical protein
MLAAIWLSGTYQTEGGRVDLCHSKDALALKATTRKSGIGDRQLAWTQTQTGNFRLLMDDGNRVMAACGNDNQLISHMAHSQRESIAG